MIKTGLDMYKKHYYKQLQPYSPAGLSGLFDFFVPQTNMTAGQVYYKNYYAMITEPDRQFTQTQNAFHKGALQKAQHENLITAEQYKELAGMIDARTVAVVTKPQTITTVSAPKDTLYTGQAGSLVQDMALAVDKVNPVNKVSDFMTKNKNIFIGLGVIVGIGLLGYALANTKGLIKVLKGE